MPMNSSLQPGSAETRAFALVVLGGGPAGTCGAGTAAVFGQRVALVEKEPEIGGAGINSGTVPSKTLRETALALTGWRSRKLHGVDLSLRREATVADFTRHQQQVSAGERRRIEMRLDALSVERFHGTASFVDPHTVRVVRRDGMELRLIGEKILIPTGSSPARPPEFRFEDDRVHDSDELLKIRALPKRLALRHRSGSREVAQSTHRRERARDHRHAARVCRRPAPVRVKTAGR